MPMPSAPASQSRSPRRRTGRSSTAPSANWLAMTGSTRCPASSSRLEVSVYVAYDAPAPSARTTPRADTSAPAPARASSATPTRGKRRRDHPRARRPRAVDEPGAGSGERGRGAQRDDGADRDAGVLDRLEEAQLVAGDADARRAASGRARPGPRAAALARGARPRRASSAPIGDPHGADRQRQTRRARAPGRCRSCRSRRERGGRMSVP